ncbi:hypothetical protein ACU8MU_25915 (plasmid) [Rhizobium leguminosarum]
MKNLLKTMAKAVQNSVFGEPSDQAAVEYVPTKDDQINDLLARVKAFNRVPVYQPTVEERKKEADTMRDLKAWVGKLSDNDRAIVMGRKPCGADRWRCSRRPGSELRLRADQGIAERLLGWFRP